MDGTTHARTHTHAGRVLARLFFPLVWGGVSFSGFGRAPFLWSPRLELYSSEVPSLISFYFFFIFLFFGESFGFSPALISSPEPNEA
jgi:hypothetical protein